MLVFRYLQVAGDPFVFMFEVATLSELLVGVIYFILIFWVVVLYRVNDCCETL